MPSIHLISFLLGLFIVVCRAAVDNAAETSLLWGPYKSNLYAGFRPRLPKSMSIGLMWSTIDNAQLNVDTLRHVVDSKDGLKQYGWQMYDVRNGGSQTIVDPANEMELIVDFTKLNDQANAGNWGLRVTGHVTDAWSRPRNVTVIVYLTMEQDDAKGINSFVDCERFPENSMSIQCKGIGPGLGAFLLDMPAPESIKDHTTALVGLNVEEEKLWQVKSVFLDQVNGKDTSQLAGDGSEHRNMHIIQHHFKSNFVFDTLYTSSVATQPIISAMLKDNAKHEREQFILRYGQVFTPQDPFRDTPYFEFGHTMLSNLVGGIGYFYGNSKVDILKQPAYDEKEPGFWRAAHDARTKTAAQLSGDKELFTAVPSRDFFPRGFLWDEGFHLLILMEWDVDLALEIIQSWLSTMDGNGWIPREQILGPEARSKVPLEFQTQYPQFANPPTLFMAFDAFLQILDGKAAYFGTTSRHLTDKALGVKFVLRNYPKLKKHYNWFRESQKGTAPNPQGFTEKQLEGYRWRGRTPEHTLTSGFDDYPRAHPPHPSELHVDALSWVGMMAMVLHRTASYLEEPDDVIKFATQFNFIRGAAETIHWSPAEKAYCDVTVESGVSTHVCHKGYVSLMPFILGITAENSPHIPDILRMINDPKQLWTKHGVRSLSLRDPNHGKGENYWRGPIWININYLLLVRLQSLAATNPAARKTYISLRQNLVDTVYESWRTTGFAWEQYNEQTGAGQGAQGFTGWTALVVRIMHMPDLRDGAKQHLGFADIKDYLKLKDQNRFGVTNLTLGALIVLGAVAAILGRRRVMGLLRIVLGRCLPGRPIKQSLA